MLPTHQIFLGSPFHQTGRVSGRGNNDCVIRIICILPTFQVQAFVQCSSTPHHLLSFPKHNRTGYRTHSKVQAESQTYTNVCSHIVVFPIRLSMVSLPLLSLYSSLPFTYFGEVTTQSLVSAVPLTKAAFCSLVQVSAGCKT